MARRCCGCGGTCCVTNKDLFVDVTFGSLTAIDNVKINAGDEGECVGMSDGYHGDPETQIGEDGWEGPTGKVAAPPAIRGAVYPTGSWQFHRYEEGFSFINNNDPDAGCYAYFGTNLIIKETGISGTVDIIKGNQPNVYPYAVRMHQMIYVADDGDCILRIGAEFSGRNDQSPGGPPSPIEFEMNSRLPFPNNLVPFARTSFVAGKYSDYNPCYEDGPVSLPGGLGEHINGGTYTLQDFDASENDKPPWSSSDPRLQQSDESGLINPAVHGLSPWQPIWVWEINLTDAGITDLASLPSTTLNSSNLAGIVTSGGIGSALDPVPADLSPYTFRYHVADSTALTSSQVGESADHTIRNQPGQHVCRIDALEGTQCNYFHDWVQYRRLQSDKITWFYEYQYENSTTDVTISAISLTLKPAAS